LNPEESKNSRDIIDKISKLPYQNKAQVWMVIRAFFTSLSYFMKKNSWIWIHGYFRLRLKPYWYKKMLIKNKKKTSKE